MHDDATAGLAGAEDADGAARRRHRRSSRVLLREDRARICLPGARVPIDLADAIRVWDEALCAQVDPELFFPEAGQPSDAAKAICETCPVRQLCLDTFGPVVDHGVVGGTSPNQRRELRRTAAAAGGTPPREAAA